MCSKKLLLVACWALLLSGLRLTSQTTTTTFVAAMSISNPDLERYFRSANISQPFATMSEERIAMDTYTYAFLNYSYGDTHVDFDEEKARYGEGNEASVHGKLVHISKADDFDDDYACSPNIMGTGGKATPEKGVDWIALVRRGRCTFEEKVKNVYEKGACGVIIYNDKSVINLEKMQIKGKWRNISAVITYHTIGLDMALKLDQGNDVYCSIIKGRSGSRPINSLNRTSVLFVSISFIVLMVISLVWLIFYYIQRFRYLQTKDQQSRQLCSVTKKAIMKIPTKTGKSSDEKDIDSDCCAICIEAYKSSDCIRVLPCKHEFHKNCIDPWLIEHRTCPMCKLDVLKFYGYVVGDQIYTTPNPQHIPQNIAPVDDNDVPVIVVAIPHSTPPSQSQSQSQHQYQHQQQQQQANMQQGHSPQTLLPPLASNASQSSASASPSPSASASALAAAPAPAAASESASASASTDINTNCDIRYHGRNHSCNFNNSNHRHHINFGNKNCRSNFSACSCQIERSSVEPLMPNSQNGVRSEEMRRNSAPQLMQVSTASRQVTDV